jgi:putative peptide-modifying radical SAM enzyme
MNYFIVLTEECNLNCSYCRGRVLQQSGQGVSVEAGDDGYDFLPEEMAYPVEALAGFCSKDPGCGIIFYGAEPLLRIDKIREIMDKVPAKRFILQTNALLLGKLPPGCLKRLQGMLISIDGDRETTDGYRGKGVYDICVKNAKLAKERGFSGELIARMTVAERTDIFRSVMHLLDLGIFDAVHWQLDAQFWPDCKNRDFRGWATASYNPGITKLVEKWLDGLREGRVLRLYPFLGIMQSLLKNERTGLRCGAGWAHYSIQTDGKIVPCPVMLGMRKFYAGDLSTDPKKLKKFDVGYPCTVCGIRGLCGGRCLYANAMKHWGIRGFREVCGTVKHLASALQSIRPEVEKLINDGVIGFEDLDYTEFNSCEIIP